MRLPETFFSRSVLAYLPLTVYGFGLEGVCQIAIWVTAVSWVSLLFFWFTRRLFPAAALKPAFFLWLLVWGQVVWTLMELQPVWVVSVFFLTPFSFLEKDTRSSRIPVFSKEVPRYFGERALAGVGFVGFVLLIAGAQKGLELCGRGDPFQRPSVVFLLIAFVALLWKNQPLRR
ncbi:MAG: hypothetical protein KTQ49_00555 [Candidatus Omnitrophica bacterium]|nr:hypothetical protein [Candidatus Omnitrophota bacterium]